MRTPKPEVSVIMPVFNGAGFLKRALGSVLSQTFQDWELIAVDDASQDESYQLLCQYGASDPRVHSQRLTQNRGPSAARNHALRHAIGSTITYLDCDDEYYPNYLQHVWRWQLKADVLVFAYDAVDDGVGLLGLGRRITWDPAVVRELLMYRNIACPLGIAHRRELLDRVGLFNESLHILEDWDLWRRFACAGAEFVFVPLKSGLYHIHPKSQSSTGRVPQGARKRNAAQ